MAGLGVVQRAKTPHLRHGSSLGEKCEISRFRLRMMIGDKTFEVNTQPITIYLSSIKETLKNPA
jgi:hypothetical protein